MVLLKAFLMFSLAVGASLAVAQAKETCSFGKGYSQDWREVRLIFSSNGQDRTGSIRCFGSGKYSDQFRCGFLQEGQFILKGTGSFNVTGDFEYSAEGHRLLCHIW